MGDDIREDRTANAFVLRRPHYRGVPEANVPDKNVVDCAAALALLQRVIDEATYDQMYAGDDDTKDTDDEKKTSKVSIVPHTRCPCACASHEQGCLIARKRSRQSNQATPLQSDVRPKRICNEETPAETVPFTGKTRVIFLNQEEGEQAAGQTWYTEEDDESSDAKCE